MPKTKRLIILSDPHCGHEIGLTPPDWQWNRRARNHRTRAVAIQQYQTWKWYEKMVKELSPVYAVICNGDGIEGKGTKSGGTELITSDMLIQATMAAKCINVWKAKKNRLTYGTGYHVGVEQDMEDAIIPLLDSKDSNIHSQQFFTVNGLSFDIKHFVSSSSVPHGRWTPLAKDKLWNKVWNNEHELQPDANILIRSHVHYHVFCGESDAWVAMTTPALQGFGSKFGKRKCAGIVHVGLIVMDVDAKGGYEWRPELLRLESQRVHMSEL